MLMRFAIAMTQHSKPFSTSARHVMYRPSSSPKLGWLTSCVTENWAKIQILSAPPSLRSASDGSKTYLCIVENDSHVLETSRKTGFSGVERRSLVSCKHTRAGGQALTTQASPFVPFPNSLKLAS